MAIEIAQVAMETRQRREDKEMTNAETEIRSLMQSTQLKYFPELDPPIFQIEKQDIDGDRMVMMRVVFDTPAKVFLYYNDNRVLEHRYRMGLVPIIAHELAHLIDPVNPERVLAERLPEPMVRLWAELRKAGLAQCSMDAKD